MEYQENPYNLLGYLDFKFTIANGNCGLLQRVYKLEIVCNILNFPHQLSPQIGG